MSYSSPAASPGSIIEPIATHLRDAGVGAYARAGGYPRVGGHPGYPSNSHMEHRTPPPSYSAAYSGAPEYRPPLPSYSAAEYQAPTDYRAANLGSYFRSHGSVDGHMLMTPRTPQVHVLIVALDYRSLPDPSEHLTCTIDGNNMHELASASGMQNTTVLYDTQCSKPAVLDAIRKICFQMGPEDTFLFFYAGHATFIEDHNGEELDDEGLVLVDAAGQWSRDTLVLDDEFAFVLCSRLPKTATFMGVFDCCHLGTMCDFKNPCWKGRQALAISGCRDNETSAHTGRGGMCTHSILLAIEALLRKGRTTFSCQELLRETLNENYTRFHSSQDITLSRTPRTLPSRVRWPLIPLNKYIAPYALQSPRAPIINSPRGCALWPPAYERSYSPRSSDRPAQLGRPNSPWSNGNRSPQHLGSPYADPHARNSFLQEPTVSSPRLGYNPSAHVAHDPSKFL